MTKPFVIAQVPTKIPTKPISLVQLERYLRRHRSLVGLQNYYCALYRVALQTMRVGRRMIA